MKVVIAPDSFKGGPSATRVAHALATGWQAVRPADVVREIPLADGGEGTFAAFATSVPGARPCDIGPVVGPHGGPVEGRFLLLPDGTALIELAVVSGLPLMETLDPLGATSRGLGQAIAAALDRGATRIILGVGGSASTDGGSGALAALGARFLDVAGDELPDGGGALGRLATVDLTGLRSPPERGVEILTDVDSPLLGERGAAAVFGPQKGADADAITRLEHGLGRLAELLEGDPSRAGSGAAGGVAYGFASVWSAELRLGSRAMADELSLGAALEDADLVITGEGRLDATSLRGKVVSTVLELARTHRVPVAIVAGAIDSEMPAIDMPDAEATLVSLTELAGSSQRSLAAPEAYLDQAGRQLATDCSRGLG